MNSNHYLLQKLLNSSSSNSGQNGSSEAEISNLDSFIAGTLSSLGAQRRNACAEELHGILPAESQENPTSILVSMKVMDHLLNAIGQGTAYETAKAMDQAFATDKAFQMKFLRANKYDPKKATDQIIRFFKMKLDLFGIEKLTKVITLEDLDENDMDCLRNGSFQVLPCKDMAGRPIIFGMTSLRTCKTMKNELRARWYMLMSVLENQDCQVARVVLVAYAVGNLRDKRVGDPDNVEMCNTLPIQFSGTHLCCDDIGQYLLLSSSIRLFQPENRARFRVHYGNHKEVQQVLTTYGIPVSALPLTRDHNTPVLGKHLEWIAKRKAIEKERESRAPTARIDTNGWEISKVGSNPSFSLETHGISSEKQDSMYYSAADVILGRGKRAQSHTGNVNMRNTLAENKEEYDAGNLTKRKEIAKRVVNKIKANGGRFLKYGDNGSWEEVSDNEARIKVTNDFRSQRKRCKLRVEGS